MDAMSLDKETRDMIRITKGHIQGKRRCADIIHAPSWSSKVIGWKERTICYVPLHCALCLVDAPNTTNGRQYYLDKKDNACIINLA